MTDMTSAATILASFRDQLATVEALPETGSVLFNMKTRLAIKLPDGDADKGHATGLAHATVFSREELAKPWATVPGLDRSYSDGNGTPFRVCSLRVAKKAVLAELENVIRSIENLA